MDVLKTSTALKHLDKGTVLLRKVEEALASETNCKPLKEKLDVHVHVRRVCNY